MVKLMPCTIGLLIHACQLSYRLRNDGTIDPDIEKNPAIKLKSHAELLKSDYRQIAGVKSKLEGGEGDSPLVAIALKSQDSRAPIIIAFRGTKTMEDMKSNFSIMSGGLAIQRHLEGALAFYKKIKDENPECEIILTGHSLGGHIAKYVNLKAHDEGNIPSKGIAVRTFNTAPDSMRYIRRFSNRPEIEKCVKNIRVSHDLISSIGILNYYGDIFSFKSKAKNLLEAHMLWFIDKTLPQSFKDIVVTADPNLSIHENFLGLIHSYECRVNNQFFSSFRMGRKNLAIFQQLEKELSPLILDGQFAQAQTKVDEALAKVSGKTSVNILKNIQEQLNKPDEHMLTVNKNEISPKTMR